MTDIDPEIVALLSRVPPDPESQERAFDYLADYRRRGMLAAAMPGATKDDLRAGVAAARDRLRRELVELVGE